uniref:Uncharacterized protein n=1 Tax=Anguilla anguilla TaxID=7936 RepID=A0A0E9TBQ3_ANGAN
MCIPGVEGVVVDGLHTVARRQETKLT